MQPVLIDFEDYSGVAIGDFAHLVFGTGAEDLRDLGGSELVTTGATIPGSRLSFA